MDPSSLERHLSTADEAQLAEALERRRKQIDREIAEFTADKEKEFRKFEKRLRSEKDAERLKILQCEREVEKANQRRRRSSDHLPVHSIHQSNGSMESADERKGSRSDGVRFSEAVEIPLDDDIGQSKQEGSKLSKGGASKHQQPSHERELEFQGLFTPTYLPLLNGKHQDLQEDTADVPSSQRDQVVGLDPINLPSRPAASSAHVQTSGSAPTTSTTPRHLSSSDPRKMSMAERRSSSRSDTSASSLRSSLRDPKQVRSPKRVLFSIDNVVVSPSTSPTMQRKVNASGRNGPSDRDVDLASPTGAVAEEGYNSYTAYAWRRNPSVQSSKPTMAHATVTNGHANGGVSRPQHPATQVWSTSPSMGGDGFEHVRKEEDDDLFAFDEDISFREKESQDEDDADEEINDEELETRKNELPTSSPHAGSLPIEIKWPERKDPRG
ncbi:MAG: hypothetical protein Q9201_004215 [Fulgogasparrea decipioides]